MAVVPTLTLPKANAAGLADKVVEVVLATPVPLTAMVAGEFGALLLR